MAFGGDKVNIWLLDLLLSEFLIYKYLPVLCIVTLPESWTNFIDN